MNSGVPKKTTPSDTASPRPAVEMRNVVKTYRTVAAVDDLSFAVQHGTVTALLGGNGAGKTTTIAMLLGLITPTAGMVRVLGADMTCERGRVAHRINFESPYMDMPMRLTVRQNLTVYAQLYGVRDPQQRIAVVSETLQIADLLERPTGKLSAGQKTRVGLAKAFLNAPELLLLDEPTASLDPDTADWVRARLQDYAQAQGATILLASHNMAEVERIADRVLMLRAGRLIEDASPRALIAKFGRGTLEDVFLDIVRGNASSDNRQRSG